MSYTIAPAGSLSDTADALYGLHCRNLSNVSEGWFRWFYADNPYGAISTWWARAEEGGLVGSTGLMRRPMALFGEVRTVGQAVNICVDREHRRVLPALKLQRTLLETVRAERLPLVCGFSETAVSLFRRVGYRDLGAVQRWVRPLRFGYKLKDRLRWEPARSIASGVGAFLLACRAGDLTFRLDAGRRLEFLPRFDQRFDRLWERLAMVYPVLGDRSRAFLEWRFTQNPTTDYGVLALSEGDGSLAGYLVYSVDLPETEPRFAAIRDLVGVDSAATDALLRGFCRYMRRAGVDALSMFHFGSSRFVDLLRRRGFFLRGEKLHVLVWTDSGSDGEADRLLDREHWHLTDAELAL